MASVSLTNEEYEEGKHFFDEIKRLVKSEQEALFRILKAERADFSENSNGIFFDVSKLPRVTFTKLKEYMDFVKENQSDLASREEEQKKAQDVIDGNA